MSKMSSLSQTIDEVKEKMCDEYCKYPVEIADDEVLRVICNKCPMNKLKGDAWVDMFEGTTIIVDGIEVKCYPDNDGRSWYYHPVTGKVVYVD
jgi:hypothetical protein